MAKFRLPVYMQKRTRKKQQPKTPKPEELLSQLISSLGSPSPSNGDLDDSDLNDDGFSYLGEQLAKKGIFFLSGEVNESIQSLISLFLLKQTDLEWKDPLRLYVNSPGGYTASGWSLVDLMGWIRVPIITVGMGLVCSMGTIILAAGTPGNRYIMPNTEIMIHQPSSSTGYGNYSQILAATEGIQQEYDRHVRFWMRVSRYKTKGDVEKHLLKKLDHFLTPKEALSHGIVDGILEKDSSV